MEREAMGDATSLFYLDNQGAQERALNKAQDDLRRQLEKDCDAVPCPACGWYQEHMRPAVGRQYRPWLAVVGACLLCAGLLLVIAFGLFAGALVDRRKFYLVTLVGQAVRPAILAVQGFLGGSPGCSRGRGGPVWRSERTRADIVWYSHAVNASIRYQ